VACWWAKWLACKRYRQSVAFAGHVSLLQQTQPLTHSATAELRWLISEPCPVLRNKRSLSPNWAPISPPPHTVHCGGTNIISLEKSSQTARHALHTVPTVWAELLACTLESLAEKLEQQDEGTRSSSLSMRAPQTRLKLASEPESHFAPLAHSRTEICLLSDNEICSIYCAQPAARILLLSHLAQLSLGPRLRPAIIPLRLACSRFSSS